MHDEPYVRDCMQAWVIDERRLHVSSFSHVHYACHFCCGSGVHKAHSISTSCMYVHGDAPLCCKLQALQYDVYQSINQFLCYLKFLNHSPKTVIACV